MRLSWMKINQLYTLIVSALFIPQGIAANSTSPKTALDVITVTAPRIADDQSTVATGNYIQPDVADWLSTIPGASINKNGPITGITQYRGLFGQRVAKNIDGHPIISAGPNAMDAPLTYLNPVMVESLSLYRGVAPVSSGIDTLGGAIDVQLKRAQPSQEKSLSGIFHSDYNENNDASSFAASIQGSGDNVGFLAYASQQQADDYEDANSRKIISTQYDKTQAGIDLRYNQNNLTLGTSWHYSKTDDTGTPALPMDIDYIDSQRFNIDGDYTTSDYIIAWKLGYQDATHGMDNYQQRVNMMDAMYRYNTAKAKTVDYKLTVDMNKWLFGLEGVSATHNADITNPNDSMFVINNFDEVEDTRHSIFAQYSQKDTQHSYTLGARLKHNKANSADVFSSMSMMNPNVMSLQSAFNNQDNEVSDTTFDIAANSQLVMNQDWTLLSGIGIKQRAPSYQERYLWLPMEASGGLADGKTYIGDVNLDAETAYKVDIGLHYLAQGFSIEPHIFYQKVDDYIQGINVSGSENMNILMVGMMMGDDAPLKFSNIDATIYGLDINWHAPINQQFSISGLVNYVRGTRDDIDDDLYRISPLNAQVSLNYSFESWESQLSVHVFDKQTKVSSLNEEKESAGYTVVDWHANYNINTDLSVGINVTNLLDKLYQPHLAGLNRAQGSELAVGERMIGRGRALSISLDYQF